MLVARLIQGCKTTRGTFLQQNIPTEEVTNGYFKTALYVIDPFNNPNRRIVIVDIIGSIILWGYESKRSTYQTTKTRWSKIVNNKNKRGFYIRGKFIQI